MEVEIRLSSRRRKTVSAVVRGDRLIISLPENMPAAERRRWTEELISRARKKMELAEPSLREKLAARADFLNKKYLDSKAAYSSVEWTARQKSLFGSCSAGSGKIRISSRVRHFPGWVLDYIILHELAHLIHPDHSPAFHSLVNRYERHREAEAFLSGYACARSVEPEASAGSGRDAGGES